MGRCEYNGRSPVGNADPTQTPRTGPTGLDTRHFEVGEGTTAEGQPRELKRDQTLQYRSESKAAPRSVDPSGVSNPSPSGRI